MTVIAAAIGDDGTFIAGDGQLQAEGLRTSMVERKISVSPDGAWAFGGAGETTYDVAFLGISWPTLRAEAGARQLAESFRERIRTTAGAEPVRDDGCVFVDYRYSPVVATHKGVWRLTSDLMGCVPPIEGRYHACGSGAEVACGAMSALVARGERSAEALVREAVAAACRIACGCGGEMQVVRLHAFVSHGFEQDPIRRLI